MPASEQRTCNVCRTSSTNLVMVTVMVAFIIEITHKFLWGCLIKPKIASRGRYGRELTNDQFTTEDLLYVQAGADIGPRLRTIMSAQRAGRLDLARTLL